MPAVLTTILVNARFSMFVVKLHGFCLSIVYIAHGCHPYIQSIDSLTMSKLCLVITLGFSDFLVPFLILFQTALSIFGKCMAMY